MPHSEKEKKKKKITEYKKLDVRETSMVGMGSYHDALVRRSLAKSLAQKIVGGENMTGFILSDEDLAKAQQLEREQELLEKKNSMVQDLAESVLKKVKEEMQKANPVPAQEVQKNETDEQLSMLLKTFLKNAQNVPVTAEVQKAAEIEEVNFTPLVSKRKNAGREEDVIYKELAEAMIQSNMPFFSSNNTMKAMLSSSTRSI